ncbi:MAG: ERF family protein [Tissierellia bacterium]|nr:ERF family protein [Tissierellia bacterium]
MSIYKKIAELQQELEVGKERYNQFGNFWHRSTEDIVRYLKPLMKKHGLLLLMKDELVHKGDRYYIEAQVSLIDIEAEGEGVSTTAYAREADSKPKFDPAQLTGSASSYARKYALGGLLAIDDSQDPDAYPPQNATPTNIKAKTNQSKPYDVPPTISEEQRQQLFEKFKTEKERFYLKEVMESMCIHGTGEIRVDQITTIEALVLQKLNAENKPKKRRTK